MMGAMLHSNVRKLLSHAVERIQARNFDLSGKDSSIPKELIVCEPLLNLVFHGIVIPILSDAQKYGGPSVCLAKAREGYKEVDEGSWGNISVIGRFLKETMSGGFDSGGAAANAASNRQLALIARQVKQSLLKYVKEQSDCADDTETHTTIDVYTSHFDRT